MASSSRDGSALVRQRSGDEAVSMRMCSPSVCRSIRAMRDTISLRSSTRASSGCLRAKASMRWVSWTPRSAAASMDWHISASCGCRATALASTSFMPMMTVRMLLKSWATPPVSWPTASIRWAWLSCCSSLMRSVMSRPMKKCCCSGSDHTPIQASVTIFPSL